MADNRTLGQMVFQEMDRRGLGLEDAAILTGISERHLRRILDDEHAPQQATSVKLERLGLTREEIQTGAFRTKMKAMSARLVGATA